MAKQTELELTAQQAAQPEETPAKKNCRKKDCSEKNGSKKGNHEKDNDQNQGS